MRKTDFKTTPNMRNIVCLNWKFWIKCKMTFMILKSGEINKIKALSDNTINYMYMILGAI